MQPNYDDLLNEMMDRITALMRENVVLAATLKKYQTKEKEKNDEKAPE